MKLLFACVMMVVMADSEVVAGGQEPWVLITLGLLSALAVVIPAIITNRRIDRTKATAEKADEKAATLATGLSTQAHTLASYDAQFQRMFAENLEVRNLCANLQQLHDRASAQLREADHYELGAEAHIDDWNQAADSEVDAGQGIRSKLTTKRPPRRKRETLNDQAEA